MMMTVIVLCVLWSRRDHFSNMFVCPSIDSIYYTALVCFCLAEQPSLYLPAFSVTLSLLRYMLFVGFWRSEEQMTVLST